MRKKQSKLKIVYGAAVAFVVLYALAVLIYLGVTYGAGTEFSNLFAVGVLCAAFCCVTVFCYYFAKNYKSRKSMLQKRDGDDCEREAPKRNKGYFAFIVAGVCLAASAFLIVWAVTGLGAFAGLQKILGGDYVKTQATVVQAVQNGEETEKLVYEYTANNGVTYQSLGDASFGGIIFKEGKSVAIYYSAENPRVTATLSAPVFLLLGALLFLFGGIAAALSGGSQKRQNLGGFAVFTFFVLFGIGFYIAGGLASGMNAFELCLSGAGYYGVTVLMLAGGLLDMFGLIALIKKRFGKKSEQTKENTEDIRE